MDRRPKKTSWNRRDIVDAIALKWPRPDRDDNSLLIKPPEYDVRQGSFLATPLAAPLVTPPDVQILPSGPFLVATYSTTGQDITYQPTTNSVLEPGITSLQPNDLMIYVGTFRGDSGTAPLRVTPPAGWEPLVVAHSNTNFNELLQDGQASHAVYYRWLGGAGESHTFASGSASTNHAADFFVIRGANRDVPFDYNRFVNAAFEPWTNRGSGFAFPAPRVVEETLVPCGLLMVGQYRLGSGGVDVLQNTPRGPFIDRHTIRSTAAATGQTIRTIIGFRRAIEGNLQNLMPDQDGRYGLINWSLVNAVFGFSSANNEDTMLLQSNTTTGRHYAWRRLTLQAGQRYSWSVIANASSSGDRGVGMTVVRPDSVELGQTVTWLGGPVIAPGPAIGPGFDDFYMSRGSDLDGSGASGHSIMTGVFVAPTTGEYEFRVNVTASGALSHSNSFTIKIGAQYLGLGYYMGPFAPSGVTKLNGNAPYNAFPTVAAPNNQSQVMNRPYTYAWTILPEEIRPVAARLEATEGDDIITRARLSEDGLTVLGTNMFEAAGSWVRADRWVPPTIGSTPGRYYCEFTILQAIGTSLGDFAISARVSTGGYSRDSKIINPTNGIYGLRFDGSVRFESSTIATGPAIVVGDIVGCAIDYLNRTVAFYVNGVLRGTVPMNQTILHHRQYMNVGASSEFGYQGTTIRSRANLRGPFGGRKPAGFAAYDWRYEVA